MLVDEIFSTPLPRDRPLWQMWIADELPDGRIAMIGKMHHCMVDGIAVVELGEMLLDADPDAGERDGAAREPVPEPSAGERLAQAVADRAADGAALALAPVGSPGRRPAAPAPGLAPHAVADPLPPAPGSSLNRQGSPRRHHVRATRPLDDLRVLRRRFGVTPNDVVLAACAGALRRFAERRGERRRGSR